MRQRSPHVVFWSCCKSQTVPFLMLMRLLTRTMKESDGNRSELMTTIMRTKRTKTMMRMMGIMRMMRMLRMRMKMKMRMVIMMSRLL